MQSISEEIRPAKREYLNKHGDAIPNLRPNYVGVHNKKLKQASNENTTKVLLKY